MGTRMEVGEFIWDRESVFPKGGKSILDGMNVSSIDMEDFVV